MHMGAAASLNTPNICARVDGASKFPVRCCADVASGGEFRGFQAKSKSPTSVELQWRWPAYYYSSVNYRLLDGKVDSDWESVPEFSQNNPAKLTLSGLKPNAE